MKVNSKHDRNTNTWSAYLTDIDGKQLGKSVSAETQDDAIFKLGYEFGATPHKFSRPLSNFFDMTSENGKTTIQI